MPETRHARVRITRRIEWMDTDAAGIYHWTCVFRLAEAAEAALHTALGIAGLTFGATPRMAISAEFVRPLRFNDEVEVELAVEDVGRTSLRYRLTIDGPTLKQTFGPINPQDTATLKVSVKPGEYTLSADGSSSITPARLTVGPKRPSAQNQLLQP